MNKKKLMKFLIDDKSIDVELTFEEMLEYDNSYCKRMILKWANECYMQSYKIQETIMDKDDFYNEGLARAYYCFNKYNADKSFVTYLNNGLRVLWLDYTKTIFAKKRKSDNNLISLNKDDADLDFNMDERVGKEDISFFRFEFKQDLHQILHNFNTEEMLLLNYLMYENTTKKDLAMRLGITRPTLDSKFKKLRNKLSNLLPEYLH